MSEHPRPDHGRPDPATISEPVVMAMAPAEAESVLADLEVLGPVACDVVRSARAVHPDNPRAALLLVGWANWVSSGHEPPWLPPAWLSPGGTLHRREHRGQGSTGHTSGDASDDAST